MEVEICFLLVGLVLGYGICSIRNRKAPVGTIREDHSDSAESPYLFLELESDAFNRIRQSKTVLLNVKIGNYLPRK